MLDFPFTFACAFAGWYFTTSISESITIFIFKIQNLFGLDILNYTAVELSTHCFLTFYCMLVGGARYQ